MKIKPLKNSILFSFVEDIINGQFVPQSASGIVLTHKNLDNNYTPKWGKVIEKGPDVPEAIEIGKYILIEPLKWMPYVVYEEQKVWKTDSDMVIAVASEAIPAY